MNKSMNPNQTVSTAIVKSASFFLSMEKLVSPEGYDEREHRKQEDFRYQIESRKEGRLFLPIRIFRNVPVGDDQHVLFHFPAMREDLRSVERVVRFRKQGKDDVPLLLFEPGHVPDDERSGFETGVFAGRVDFLQHDLVTSSETAVVLPDLERLPSFDDRFEVGRHYFQIVHCRFHGR